MNNILFAYLIVSGVMLVPLAKSMCNHFKWWQPDEVTPPKVIIYILFLPVSIVCLIFAFLLRQLEVI